MALLDRMSRTASPTQRYGVWVRGNSWHGKLEAFEGLECVTVSRGEPKSSLVDVRLDRGDNVYVSTTILK